MLLRRTISASLCLICLLSSAQSRSAEPAKAKKAKPKQEQASKFLRIVKDKKGQPLSMDTSIVRYESRADAENGVTVDLVSAVHIGDKKYFEELNKAFDDYEVVLYELVAPEGTRVPKGGAPADHPVAVVQHGMKDLLELEYQLSEIDYTRENFVHADMSPDEFSKSMADRGESVMGMLFKAMGQSLAQQSSADATTDLEVLGALFAADRPLKLKRVMATQFEDLEKAVSAFGGADGSTILTERNKAALRVLKKQIAAGKKKIAIYYGGAHMPDMSKRLETEFDLAPKSERWITAWDLRSKS
jgi:hypothetical protein